jgi:hypothetical protein
LSLTLALALVTIILHASGDLFHTWVLCAAIYESPSEAQQAGTLRMGAERFLIPRDACVYGSFNHCQ